MAYPAGAKSLIYQPHNPLARFMLHCSVTDASVACITDAWPTYTMRPLSAAQTLDTSAPAIAAAARATQLTCSRPNAMAEYDTGAPR
jgi:hypothetical protein